MKKVRNTNKQFRKSSYCGSDSPTCVEVQRDRKIVSVRDSKHPQGPVLQFNHDEWTDFLKGAVAGEFNV